MFPTAWYGLSSSLRLSHVAVASFFPPLTSQRPVSGAHESQPSSDRTYLIQTESGETLNLISYRRSGRLKCGLRLSLASTQPGHESHRDF